MIGIIGGTGTDSLKENYAVTREEQIVTKYGKAPSISILEIDNKEVAYIPRHSKGHSVPPHMINYRANIAALDTSAALDEPNPLYAITPSANVADSSPK